MPPTPDSALAEDIEVAVRRTPGVAGLFRPGGAVSTVLGAGTRALGFAGADGTLARVEDSPEGPRIDVWVEVDAQPGAVETCRRVQAEIGAVCASHQVRPAEIRVTVVHVNDVAPQAR